MNKTQLSILKPLARLIAITAIVSFVLPSHPAKAQNISRVGQWPDFARGSAAASAVTNNLAYVATSFGLAIMDVSSPSNVMRLGDLNIGWATDVKVAGGYAYVVGDLLGLQVIDVSNPNNPVLVGSCPILKAVRVLLAGHYAYVANGDWYSGGLEVIDVSNPANPTRVGGCKIETGASDIQLSGHYVLALGILGGVSTIDVNNPLNPVLVGRCGALSGSNGSLAVSENYAYVADLYSECALNVADISDPTSCKTKGCFISFFRDMVIQGRYLYGVNPAGFQVVDLSNPTSLLRVGSCSAGDYPVGVTLEGRYAYVAESAGLRVIDVSNPASPIDVGGWVSGGRVSTRDVVADGDYAYLSDSAGLQVINVKNPNAPVWVGGYDGTNWSAEGVAVAGQYVYAANSEQGLDVIDVRDPTKPVRVGGFNTSGRARDVAVVGHYAYVADGNAGLQVIDVSNPNSPVRAGGYDTSGDAYGVAVAGRYAYVADGDAGLQVIDVGNPAAPVRVGVWTNYSVNGISLGWASRVAIVGHYAYVADGVAGLQVIDVNNPASPVLVGSCPTTNDTYYVQFGDAKGIVVVGNYAYVATDQILGSGQHRGALVVVDVTNPANPIRVKSYDASGSDARGVAAVGGYVYLAEFERGLAILQVSTGPTLDLGWKENLPQLRLTGAVGSKYAVDSAPSLISGTWESLFTNLITSNPLTFTDTNASGAAQRFYRARLVP